MDRFFMLTLLELFLRFGRNTVYKISFVLKPV